MNQAIHNDPQEIDRRYRDAVDAVQRVLTELGRCTEEERAALSRDAIQLRQMLKKLRDGRVDIVVFGEISTGKSAMINALVGEEAASVSAEGGWTRESWLVAWDKCGYHIPGLADSKVALIDTPGINEVEGEARAQLARDAAAHGDLILFVTDSDLNQTEYESLCQLIKINRPVIVVLNKKDLYTQQELDQLVSAIRDERFVDALPPEDLVLTAADPKKVEYVIEEADGTTRTEMRSPGPDTEALRARILDILGRDGKSLLAFNAAMFASDKSDKIASLKVKMRERKANKLIWAYAASKAVATAANPVPLLDIFGGTLVDASQIVALGSLYDIKMSKRNAAGLVKAIMVAGGLVTLSQVATHLGAGFLKGITAGAGTFVTAPVQGAAAGYGSYIVGQAAKYYLEHGASWGGKSPKAVVSDIIANTDKDSVIQKLKEEVKNKLKRNPHANPGT
ncbi:MAG: GTP-binding protein [Phycisphaerales bacterium]